MHTKSKSVLFSLAVFLVLLAIHGLGVSAFAYDDPPSRVARLSFIEGDVSFQPGGEQDWVWAGQNRPLTTGDSLWLDQNGRAEMHIGSTPILIGERTALTLLNVDDNTIQLQLNSGSVDIPVRNFYQNQIVEIDTPNSAFTVSRRGHYRVSVDPDSSTTLVTVWEGQGEVDGGGQAFLVDSGSQAQISGYDSINYDVYDLPNRDSFDQWSDSRIQRESRYQSSRYVSPEMTGYEDLDQDGRWRSDPNYGEVWTPSNVSQDWAPYRQGHWAWVSPWGWTWVDDQPFGFVTSHYGRWAFLGDNGGGGGWGWIPPRREQDGQRPVYSPALVMFAGDANLSSGFGSDGGVAWFPLAPGEVFVPSYQTSPTYITQINVTNTAVQPAAIATILSNPTRHENYANQKVAGAVTAVPKTVFVNAQPVAKAAVKVSVAAITAASVVRSAPAAPVKTSVIGGTSPSAPSHAGAGASARSATPPAPPKAVVSRAVVAKVAPPPPPVPFAQKEKALAGNGGKPLDPSAEQKLRASAPAPVRVVKTAPKAPEVKQAVAAPKPQSSAPAANARGGASAANKQQPSSQPQSADKAHQQMTQQEQQKAQQQTAQQDAEKNHQQQATQQEQQKAHQQQMAQQEADKVHQQQLTQQEQQKAHQQQMAQQEAEKAHQQQATQQEARTHQQQMDQQEAGQSRQQPGEPPQDHRGNPPNGPGPHAGGPPEGQPVRVPESALAAKLISQPKLNPPAGVHVHGVVRVQALIGTDGRVKNASVLSGPPPLHSAALENVRQRQYQPTQVNGKPTEVETEITVPFE